MMSITSYSDLSSVGKIVFTRFKLLTVSKDEIAKLLNTGKITQEEYNFIIGN